MEEKSMKNNLDQSLFRSFLQENQFIVPSSIHYGGASGFQDYGLNGLKLKNKLIQTWRDVLANEFNCIFEIETPTLMVYPVLKASGHVDRFTDYIVTTEPTIDKSPRAQPSVEPNEVLRADHVVKKWFKSNNMPNEAAKVDDMKATELQEAINKYVMLGQKKDLIVTTKNLMFCSEIHSKKDDVEHDLLFLRPEIAQGIFINYKQVRDYLHREVNFGICQVGKSYRKEISPQPLTRLREFTQAEIEFFCDPLDKFHPGYDKVEDDIVPILTDKMQLAGLEAIPVQIGQAITTKLISHKLMAFFLAKIYQFALTIGLNKDKIRFRQHLPNEKAHYSIECWDLEAYVDGDWLEVVGIADRGNYDLTAHSKVNPIVARRKFKVPIESKQLQPVLNMKVIGTTFKKLAPKVQEEFEKMSQNDLLIIRKHLESKEPIHLPDINIDQVIDETMIEIKEIVVKKEYEEFVPHVVEPSIGIDRILYAVLEHNFYRREEDQNRIIMALNGKMSLYDVAIASLLNRDDLWKIVHEIELGLKKLGLRCYVDNSSTSLGKKYVRADELGIHNFITVDVQTLEDHKVTIRDRDSMKQIRVDIDMKKLSDTVLSSI